MGNEFKPLDVETEHRDAVLSFLPSMFKVNEFVSTMVKVFQDRGLEELKNTFSHQGRGTIPSHDKDSWFGEGISCEILQPSKTWKKGKVRIKITLEFCPDEPEVPESLAIQPKINKTEPYFADITGG